MTEDHIAILQVASSEDLEVLREKALEVNKRLINLFDEYECSSC